VKRLRLPQFLVAGDESSPFQKQGPVLIGFIVAIILTLTVPGVLVTDSAAAAAAVAIMSFACLLAPTMTFWPRLQRWAIVIPLIDLLAIAFYRVGTGAAASIFGALLILPVVWIASEPGRRYVLIAALGTAIALYLPSILEFRPPRDAIELLHGIVTPVVFGGAAAIINLLSRQARERVQSIRLLAQEREVMLKGAVDYADRLTENEQRLRLADQLTRSVLDAVTEQSVIGSDVTGLIEVWNPGAEKMLGLSGDETVGKKFMHEFHVKDELLERSKELNYPPGETVLNPGFSALVESARMGNPEVRQWTYVRADGKTLTVEVAVTRRVDSHGNTSGYIFVATDVTQAMEVSRMKDEFVGLISHELRTPLSSILGYLELLSDDDIDPLSEEQLQYLHIAERNAHRLLRLVGDLLFTAQVGSSTFELQTVRTEIGPIVRAAIESAAPNAAAAGISLTTRLPDQTSLVDADPVRLGQACDNLISNAIKFTPRGGTVSVSVRNEEESVVIRFIDTGMGIPAAELDKLFSRFFRASTATKAAVPGVGLGLSITKAIVLAHHGELSVESVEGKGTSFILKLPLAEILVEPVPAG
jgi:signal transduction histidine kinase